MMVGAPLANVSRPAGLKQPGAVYRCAPRGKLGGKKCVQILVDPEGECCFLFVFPMIEDFIILY